MSICLIFCSSCSLEKRLHRKGYYIPKRNKVAVIKSATSIENKKINDRGGSVREKIILLKYSDPSIGISKSELKLIATLKSKKSNQLIIKEKGSETSDIQEYKIGFINASILYSRFCNTLRTFPIASFSFFGFLTNFMVSSN